MILEAFSHYLHASDPKTPATTVLARWLWERLSTPAEDNVGRVLHREIQLELPAHAKPARYTLSMKDVESSYSFSTNSATGQQLLKSLHEYALSYETQKWSRFIHCVKASDFNNI